MFFMQIIAKETSKTRKITRAVPVGTVFLLTLRSKNSLFCVCT